MSQGGVSHGILSVYPCVLFPSVDDTLEISSLEGSATNEAAVNVGLSKDFLGVAGLAASAVQDGNVLSSFCTKLFGDDAADEGVHIFGLLGGEVEERTFELCLHHFILLAALALFEHFANAEDYFEAVLESQVGLLLENFGGFAIVGAAFAVAEDDILCTRALDHGCGNLTRVGTAHFVGAVFGTQTDDIGIQFAGYGSQVNEGGADDYVAVGFVGGEHCVEFLGESYAFLQVEVHFPVTCYDFLSHWFMFFRVDNYY